MPPKKPTPSNNDLINFLESSAAGQQMLSFLTILQAQQSTVSAARSSAEEGNEEEEEVSDDEEPEVPAKRPAVSKPAGRDRAPALPVVMIERKKPSGSSLQPSSRVPTMSAHVNELDSPPAESSLGHVEQSKEGKGNRKEKGRGKVVRQVQPCEACARHNAECLKGTGACIRCSKHKIKCKIPGTKNQTDVASEKSKAPPTEVQASSSRETRNCSNKRVRTVYETDNHAEPSWAIPGPAPIFNTSISISDDKFNQMISLLTTVAQNTADIRSELAKMRGAR